MTRGRWWVVSLLFLATVINYVDRQTLSVLAPVLRDEFHMTNTDYSRIVFAFLLAYMVMQSGAGKMMDHMGTRRGFSLIISWWSAAAMLHATATSILSFGLFRFLLGLGEAGNWPGGVKVISEWFPPKERAFATGIFNCGSALGAVIAPPLVAWIALTWGWRAAFWITGALGFLWLALWLFTYRTPPKPEWDITVTGRIPWRSLFRYRQVWSLLLARMLADPVWWFYVFWLPEYLKRERNFSLVEIGYFVWIPFLTADIGNLLGGALSGYLIRLGWPVLRARKVVMAASAVVMTAGIPAVRTHDAMVALALISLVTMAYSLWAANVLTLPADLFPNDVVASVSGISGTGAAFGGMIFTLLTGVVIDRFSYLPVFTAAGVMPLVAAACILAGIRTVARADENAIRVSRV
ncbi:MAG: MFS transporter [Bryobacterales bacterium]|nr:MFS transporter [Bryobacterales bacterium]